jgi:hypothetical protein
MRGVVVVPPCYRLPLIPQALCTSTWAPQVLLVPSGGGTPVRLPAVLLALHSRLFLDMHQSGMFDSDGGDGGGVIGGAAPAHAAQVRGVLLLGTAACTHPRRHWKSILPCQPSIVGLDHGSGLYPPPGVASLSMRKSGH